MAERAKRPEEIVRSGWDRASLAYRPDPGSSDAFGHGTDDYRQWLAPVGERLRPGDPVLDLGSGCGVPTSALLAERFNVTGVDISKVQVDRARHLVPLATFVQGDMTEIDFPERSFAAVVCLYALIHVPVGKQFELLRKVRRWLVPGGAFLVTTGHRSYEGVEENWLGSGATMYWSHTDVATYRTWLRQAGFEIEFEEFVPEGDSGHELFRAVTPR